MRFFFPDSMDLIDPSFDFVEETRNENRLRHRDDLYAHEIFDRPPYDGLLVSKAIVDGTQGGSGKYSVAQRHRLLRGGVRDFFRLDRTEATRSLETIGDCGAFTYVKEDVPPYSVDEVIDFYETCGFDYGVTVDHVILGFKPDLDHCLPGIDAVPEDWRERQKITLDLAADFLRVHKNRRCRFTPVGVVQGWSPDSCAAALRALQEMGYRRIALGGLVSLDTRDILAVLQALDQHRAKETQLHLFGVTRCGHLKDFERFGVTSFDSTAPLRQAFKDDKDNYQTVSGHYTAIRVPQVEANPSLKRRIVSGAVDQGEARANETRCMDLLLRYGDRDAALEETLDALQTYERLFNPERDSSASNRRTLEDRPWEQCDCEICQQLGIHVVIFRGAERNRRRGLHNVRVLYDLVRDREADRAVRAVG